MYELLIAYVSIACILGPMFALSPVIPWSFVNYEPKAINHWFKKVIVVMLAGILWPILIKNMWR